jgi:PAS domain S-box-containing protein
MLGVEGDKAMEHRNEKISQESVAANGQLSRELQEALEYAENILLTIREPLLVLDADLRIITANQPFYRIFSTTPQETEGNLIYELGHGQWNIPQLRKQLEDILPKNNSFEAFEVDHEFPGIGRRIMVLNARRMHNSGLRLDKILLAIEDITERRRFEHDVVYSELRYRRLFETAQDGILILNAQTGDITDVNPFLTNMLGYSKQELLGKKLWEIGFIKDSAASHQAFQVLQEKGYVRYEDLPLETKDGNSMDVEFVSNVYPLDGEMVIQCDIRDITVRKNAEEEITRSVKELEQFAYVASHDLREPLRMITSFSQLLEKHYKNKLDSNANEYIGFIVDGAYRMQNLIDDLLLYSRVGTRGKPFEPTDMEAVLQDVMANLKVSIEESKTRITHDPLPVVRADATQMNQVLQNLISNAIKFRREESPQVHISATKGLKEWIFSVKDNGIGIDPQLFDRLFILFQRLQPREKYPGTGIGLAVAKKVVQRHGGRIWVESRPGEGSTFFFTIPLRSGREGNA